jgi:hypothetical protein
VLGFAADITGALKSALPQGSISTGCPITAYKQLEDGTIQLLGPAASSSSDSSDAEVIATCKILIGEHHQTSCLMGVQAHAVTLLLWDKVGCVCRGCCVAFARAGRQLQDTAAKLGLWTCSLQECR